MEKIDALKAENKCETCKDAEICGSASYELISSDDIDYLKENGIKVIAVVYECKHYLKR